MTRISRLLAWVHFYWWIHCLNSRGLSWLNKYKNSLSSLSVELSDTCLWCIPNLSYVAPETNLYLQMDTWESILHRSVLKYLIPRNQVVSFINSGQLSSIFTRDEILTWSLLLCFITSINLYNQLDYILIGLKTNHRERAVLKILRHTFYIKRNK